jgi:hypothetical protein
MSNQEASIKLNAQDVQIVLQSLNAALKAEANALVAGAMFIPLAIKIEQQAKSILQKADSQQAAPEIQKDKAIPAKTKKKAK